MDPTHVDPLAPEIQATDARRWGKRPIVDDQPTPSMPMTSDNVQSSGGGDRNALKVPISNNGVRKWSFGLFDCFSDCRTCVQSTCCCCYVYSRNKQRLEHLERHGTPLREPVKKYNYDCKWHLLLHCGLFCGLGGWGLQAISRSDLRRRYGIRGNADRDVATSLCCGPCGLVQEHREIQLEESSFYSL